MSENFIYYGKHRRKINSVAPNKVLPKDKKLKNFVLRSKVDIEIYKKVKSEDIKEGELIRSLLKKYFGAKELIENLEDVNHFLENYENFSIQKT